MNFMNRKCADYGAGNEPLAIGPVSGTVRSIRSTLQEPAGKCKRAALSGRPVRVIREQRALCA